MEALEKKLMKLKKEELINKILDIQLIINRDKDRPSLFKLKKIELVNILIKIKIYIEDKKTKILAY